MFSDRLIEILKELRGKNTVKWLASALNISATLAHKYVYRRLSSARQDELIDLMLAEIRERRRRWDELESELIALKRGRCPNAAMG